MSNFLLDSLNNLEAYKDLKKDIENKKSPIATFGIIEESIGHIVYALKEHTDRQILLITYNESRSRRLYEDIKNLGGEKVHLLTKRELTFFDVDAFSSEDANERVNIVSKLAKGENIILVASIEAILNKFMDISIFKSLTKDFQNGEEIDLTNIVDLLIKGGYERVEMVEAIGQFSLRGGIFDFFSPEGQYPYRIELFDNEIDSIRTFDILSQRSIEILDVAHLVPVGETLILDDYREETIEALVKDLNKVLSKGKFGDREKENLINKFNKYRDYLEEKMFISNKNLVLPYIPKDYLSSIINYLDNESLIFVDEPKRIEESVKNIKEDFVFKFTDLFSMGELLYSHENILYTLESLLKEMDKKTIITNSAILGINQSFNPKSIHNFNIKGMQSYHNKMELLKEDLNHFKYRGYKTIILSGTEERGRRLHKTLLEMNIESSFLENKDDEIKSSQIFITPGSIKGGFEYSKIKFIVLSDKEVFGAARSKRRKKYKKASKQISLVDLSVGDYVVHENHGIGRYEGVEQLDIQGIKKDYLTIRYRGQDKLYVHVDQMNLIQKHSGSEGIKLRINKLSSAEWSRTKAKVKKAVEEMAEDLLELYAKRESYKGFSFSEDTEWQKQFEDLFPYEETEGQLDSIIDIKKDMENTKPMDRLLCGDVGYGKTEVALRAAFKAIMDSKQVVFLVPTTILAQQHYDTMIKRFSEFPIKIGVLSRFVSKAKQKLTIDNMRKGLIDIVVGTHRLLSKDIIFKDLGLLIIDEEQRFGVKHKETLKQLKETVDVLTLTATPIPRTLHMSLSGVRDMSVIDDPPEERYPVQTYVVEYNEQMVRDAIIKEISRGGQVYYVYNRVDNIDKVAWKLKELIPEAEFGIGHGQMGERQLEKVMVDFLNKDIDVLVCTTIIETGLDIPNVNTIIIHNADKMGLSQLYQLRGRVGRSSRLAYGYFTYERNKVLSEVAEKRLRAIKEFTEFGSGFKIAMRDLEIRGAGSLLGLKQHGHIESIGYDLYVKFLNEAVRKLKGEIVVENINTTIDLEIDGYIKHEYIKDEEQKIEIYKKISAVSSIEDYRELIDELIDRFGDLPKEVENLIDVSYIRSFASKNSIKNISQTNKEILLEFDSNKNISIELLQYLSEEYKKGLKFDLSKAPSFRFRFNDNMLYELKTLVEKINSFNKENNDLIE